MLLEALLIFSCLVAGFGLGCIYCGGRQNAKEGTPSASHNRQITKPASCEDCEFDYASITCSTCAAWLPNKQRQAS
jgi:hypothetical protein